MHIDDIVAFWRGQQEVDAQGRRAHRVDRKVLDVGHHIFNLDYPVSPYVGNVLTAPVIKRLPSSILMRRWLFEAILPLAAKGERLIINNRGKHWRLGSAATAPGVVHGPMPCQRPDYE